MAEGTKVGGAYVELGVDDTKLQQGLNGATAKVEEFGTKAEASAGKAEKSTESLGRSYGKLVGMIGRVTGAIGFFVGALTAAIAAQDKLAASVRSIGVAYEGLGRFNEAAEIAIAKTNRSLNDQQKAVEKSTSELTSLLDAALERQRQLADQLSRTTDTEGGLLGGETKRKLLAEFDDVNKAIEKLRAARAIETERAINQFRFDEFKKESDRRQDLLKELAELEASNLDEIGKLRRQQEADYQKFVQAGLDAEAERVRAVYEERIRRIREAERKQKEADDKKAEDDRRRQEEMTQQKLDDIRRVAQEQALRDRALPGNLSAGSGEEATKLLRKIARATSASRYGGYTGVGSGAF